MKLSPIALALAITFASAPSAMAGPATTTAPFTGDGQPVVFGRGYDLPSATYGTARRINVLLPAGYDEAKNATLRYPVLYLLDGGTGWQDFVHIAAMVQQGGLWGGNAPVIVVGVESGDRRAEFTRPSTDAAERRDFPTTGQAARFRRFLTTEVKPAVSAAYRTDGTSGLIGESLAGLFVVDTALHHGTDFDRYIAISPSLWWSHGLLAQEAGAALRQQPDARWTLWLALADEGAGMQAGMDRLIAALTAAALRHARFTYVAMPGETHATIYHPAATRAVRALFPAAPPPR